MLHSPWIAALIALFSGGSPPGRSCYGGAPGKEGARLPGRAVMWNLPALSRRVRLRRHPVAVDAQRRRRLSGFLSALAIWGWIELAFLTGIITGPVNQTPLPEGHREWERFIRAWGTVAYHEMLLAFLIADDLRQLRGREPVRALDLRRALHRADQAKLNLYLGVPKIKRGVHSDPARICPAISASPG
jgi:putative photosynthetic complex assembly protein 2